MSENSDEALPHLVATPLIRLIGAALTLLLSPKHTPRNRKLDEPTCDIGNGNAGASRKRQEEIHSFMVAIEARCEPRAKLESKLREFPGRS